MRESFVLCLLGASLLSLTACAFPTVPAYQPSSTEKTTKLNIASLQTPMICVNHTWKSLVPDQNGFVDIPSNQIVLIKTNYSYSISSLVDFCSPVAAFFAATNQSYRAESQVVPPELLGQKDNGSFLCFLEIYKYTKENYVGLKYIRPSKDHKNDCQ